MAGPIQCASAEALFEAAPDPALVEHLQPIVRSGSGLEFGPVTLRGMADVKLRGMGVDRRMSVEQLVEQGTAGALNLRDQRQRLVDGDGVVARNLKDVLQLLRVRRIDSQIALLLLRVLLTRQEACSPGLFELGSDSHRVRRQAAHAVNPPSTRSS